MSFQPTVYRNLIASPSGEPEERALARELIHLWNHVNADHAGAVMLLVMWETHALPEMGDRPQAILNKQLVDDCDALIGIFWTRIGTPTEVAESGSVEEIKRLISLGKPTMLYFSFKPVAPDNLDVEQWSRLTAFRKECESSGIVHRFASLDELRKDLFEHLLRMGQRWSGVEPRPLPQPGVGQYPGMVYQVVAPGVAGWDYVRAHAMPDERLEPKH